AESPQPARPAHLHYLARQTRKVTGEQAWRPDHLWSARQQKLRRPEKNRDIQFRLTLSSKTYWQFPMTSFAIGSYSSNTKLDVISDTGTSWIGAPSS
ncbi:hypothetical protein PENTCL1PPCAC_12258, partial [Pristionchus entomophagus]